MTIESFIRGLPKAELHLHIEGTLEPELMLELAAKNRVPLPYPTVEAARAAYDFQDLQSFLDLYYAGMSALRTKEDFTALARAYFEHAAKDHVRHAELFFDPQAHTSRGVALETVLDGLEAAMTDAKARHGISASLILCFLRHLDEEDALRTLDAALPHKARLVGVGLDSGERGNPPEKFERVFRRAREAGLRAVAHAGEEGPPAYIYGALDHLAVERIDHGVRAEEDPALVERLAREQVPLTVCPLSNVKLRVFDRLEAHNLGRLLARGVRVTINSDDPAYFGGYVTDNFLATAKALGLGKPEVVAIARNAFEAAFLPDTDRQRLLAELETYARENT